MNKCSVSRAKQRRLSDNERVGLLRVPQAGDELRETYKQLLGWVDCVPMPDEAYICHTHFPEAEIVKTKTGYKRKSPASLPTQLNPKEVAEAYWQDYPGDKSVNPSCTVCICKPASTRTPQHPCSPAFSSTPMRCPPRQDGLVSRTVSVIPPDTEGIIHYAH